MENARLPIVDSLTAGTVGRFVTAERKACLLYLYKRTNDGDHRANKKLETACTPASLAATDAGTRWT